MTNPTIGTIVTAPTSTTLQANFKLPNGDLLNVYGNDVLGFKQGLEDLGSLAELVSVTGNALRGVSVVVDAGLTAAPGAQADPTAPWDRPQAPAPSFAVAQPQYVQAFHQPAPQQEAPTGPPAPQCQHGSMVVRSGEKNGRAWSGAFCPTPKGTVGQCDPVFNR